MSGLIMSEGWGLNRYLYKRLDSCRNLFVKLSGIGKRKAVL